jgi:hypothetical protein
MYAQRLSAGDITGLVADTADLDAFTSAAVTSRHGSIAGLLWVAAVAGACAASVAAAGPLAGA